MSAAYDGAGSEGNCVLCRSKTLPIWIYAEPYVSTLGVNSVRKLFSLAVRWGLLGLVSGLLSCVMSQSYIIYVVREQKTLDHIVWPGMVFALVVLLPISRWAGDGWLRTAAALIASSAVYPIAWLIAASGIGRSGASISAFAFAGVLGLIRAGERVLVRTATVGEGGLRDRDSWHGSWRAYGRASACGDDLCVRWRCAGSVYGRVADRGWCFARSRSTGKVPPVGGGNRHDPQLPGRRA